VISLSGNKLRSSALFDLSRASRYCTAVLAIVRAALDLQRVIMMLAIRKKTEIWVHDPIRGLSRGRSWR